jgi:hypothetical protein
MESSTRRLQQGLLGKSRKEAILHRTRACGKKDKSLANVLVNVLIYQPIFVPQLSLGVLHGPIVPTRKWSRGKTRVPRVSQGTRVPSGTDNFRMNTGMVDTAPPIIWLL